MVIECFRWGAWLLMNLNGKNSYLWIHRELYFLRSSLTEEPYEIEVPKVTRKERLYLDKMMPCDDSWVPTEFELKPEKVLAYRNIYRYYPAYIETLL